MPVDGADLGAVSDVFGHTLYTQDLGGNGAGFTFDLGGRQVGRSAYGETVTTTWFNTGLASGVTSDLGQGTPRAYETYAYDAAGRADKPRPSRYIGFMTEHDFLLALRALPLHPGARGLLDDAAVVDGLVLTTDTLVEGVHFLPRDPAADVAWKLVAVSLSDLAAKGAVPEGVLLNHPLSDAQWDAGFLGGLAEVLAAHGTALIGGDTVSLPHGAPRVLTVTALGRGPAPSRTGARAGDALWVTGTIGDGGAGLRVAQGEPGPATLLAAYRRPAPRLAEGRALAPHVHAMCDVSDGLLIDTARLATASGLAATVALDAVPLSPAYRAFSGDDPLTAATAGDDYQLLFAGPAGWTPPVPATRIGALAPGSGLTLTRGGLPVPLPPRLGFEHIGS